MQDHKITDFWKGQFRAGFKFLVGIATFYTLFWIIISSLNLYVLKALIADISSGLLNFFGIPAIVLFGTEPAILVPPILAQITNLCAGDIEIALLMAIILATWDRPIRKRLWGCFFGLILIFVMNPIRIFTVLAVGYYTSWIWADFTHDFLFRAMLLIIIVVYYFIWYVKYDCISEKISKFKKRFKK